MVVCVVGALAALQSATSPTAAPSTAPSIAPGIDPSFAPSSAYGELLVSSLAVVAVICVLAFVVVRIWGRGGLGLGGGARRKRGGLLEVIARQPLEPRRSLYVVRAGTRTLLVGTSELGVTLLTELEGADGVGDGVSHDAARDAEAPATGGAASAAGFGELVRRATQRLTARRSAAAAAARGAGEGPA